MARQSSFVCQRGALHIDASINLSHAFFIARVYEAIIGDREAICVHLIRQDAPNLRDDQSFFNWVQSNEIFTDAGLYLGQLNVTWNGSEPTVHVGDIPQKEVQALLTQAHVSP